MLGQRVVSIRVKGESSGQLALNVNGKEIGEDRVGLKVSWAVGKTAWLEVVAPAEAMADGCTQVPVGAEGATFDLVPPEVAGSRTVTVESSFHAVEKAIVFLPDLRPMIATGVVEGAFGAGAGGGVAIWSARGT